MFRATQATLSKASRLPLTSKKANKDFYKGAILKETQLTRQEPARPIFSSASALRSPTVRAVSTMTSLDASGHGTCVRIELMRLAPSRLWYRQDSPTPRCVSRVGNVDKTAEAVRVPWQGGRGRHAATPARSPRWPQDAGRWYGRLVLFATCGPHASFQA